MDGPLRRKPWNTQYHADRFCQMPKVVVANKVTRILKFIYSEKATKFCEIFTLLLSYEVPVKSKVKILQIFLAFLECINFTKEIFGEKKILVRSPILMKRYCVWRINKDFCLFKIRFVANMAVKKCKKKHSKLKDVGITHFLTCSCRFLYSNYLFQIELYLF